MIVPVMALEVGSRGELPIIRHTKDNIITQFQWSWWVTIVQFVISTMTQHLESFHLYGELLMLLMIYQQLLRMADSPKPLTSAGNVHLRGGSGGSKDRWGTVSCVVIEDPKYQVINFQNPTDSTGWWMVLLASFHLGLELSKWSLLSSENYSSKIKGNKCLDWAYLLPRAWGGEYESALGIF